MKPYVICHMCTTIDGRIIGERWPGGIDSGKLFETTANTFGIKVARYFIRSHSITGIMARRATKTGRRMSG